MPRKFREGLKKGSPLIVGDRNIRLPDKNGNQREAAEHVSTADEALNIVYDSEKKHLVPYPDAEVIRTSSPEHLGIPAASMSSRMKVPLRVRDEEQYTSDDSFVQLSPARKFPVGRRKVKTRF